MTLGQLFFPVAFVDFASNAARRVIATRSYLADIIIVAVSMGKFHQNNEALVESDAVVCRIIAVRVAGDTASI